jgi:photosystem II stability/assembly factor-like uncharacterized protein
MTRLLLVALLALPALAADPAAVEGMKYRSIGPYAGGRVSRACGVVGDPLTYYAATASGGVWKSADGGLNWKPIFDDQPTASIGSIAVAPSDANVIYVGTGEANIRGNVAPGAGIFRSTDAGKTWQHQWKQVGQIGTMAVHPKNADIAYAAVLGHAFGPNAERGVYRTTDGGKTWKNIKFIDDSTGCSDVAIDPNNPRNVYAGFWHARRTPWDLTSGGPTSDLFVSHDGGDTWKSVKNDQSGLPAGPWGKIGVAVSPAAKGVVYAIIEAEKGGLFRSDDGGGSWKLTSDDRVLRQRAWYYSTITLHPNNADIVYLPNVPLLKSIDGGRSFATVRGSHHGDYHDHWIDPNHPDRMINANDGGVDISLDGGRSWFAPPLPISQFYHVNADNRTPYHVMGNMQDLGTASGPSRSFRGRIGAGEWVGVGGGETGFSVPDPVDSNIIYSGEYGGILTRHDRRTGLTRNITVAQWNPSGIDPAKHKFRFQWTAPVVVSAHDRSLYHAGNCVFRSRDGGQTWEKISPDLTRDDKRKQGWSGGPITGDNTGAETYCTIFAFAESPKQKGLFWAGSDDGLLHVSKDDGKTWDNITANIPELPDWGTVCCIEASPHDPATAFVVVRNHRMDDYRPHAWKTSDYGKTWEKIVGGLDPAVHLHALREDPTQKGLLVAGTDRGIVVSADAGKNWQSLKLNLPTVPVHDLIVKNDDLVVGTHGRSLWILDDIAPLRAWAKKEPAKALAVLPAKPATRWVPESGGGAFRFFEPSGENPVDGAAVWFTLKDSPKKLTVEILDAAGKPVAKATGKPDGKKDDDDKPTDGLPKREFSFKKGLNRFVWDLTHDGAEFIPGAQVDAGDPDSRIPALPGTYTLKLTADQETATVNLTFTADPRLDPKAISAEQTVLGLRVRDGITSLSRTVKEIRTLQKQLTLRKELFKDDASKKELLKDSEAFGKKLSELEEKLHNPKAKVVYDIFAARGGAMLYSQFVWLLANSTSGEGPPTKAMLEFADECAKKLAALQADWAKLKAEDAVKLNASAKAAGVPELYVPK